MESKIFKANVALLLGLTGLTYDEILRKEEKELRPGAYLNIIKGAFSVFRIDDSGYNNLFIDRDGDVYMRIDKFTIDISKYKIHYEECYENEDEAINNVSSEWLKIRLINARNAKKFKKYINSLEKIAEADFKIKKIEWNIYADKLEVELAENEHLDRKTYLYLKWPKECVPYLQERFDNECLSTE